MTGKKYESGKVYKGTIVEFTKKEKEVGHGGNVRVFDIDIVNNNIYDFPVVVKFFECDKKLPKKRKRTTL